MRSACVRIELTYERVRGWTPDLDDDEVDPTVALKPAASSLEVLFLDGPLHFINYTTQYPRVETVRLTWSSRKRELTVSRLVNTFPNLRRLIIPDGLGIVEVGDREAESNAERFEQTPWPHLDHFVGTIDTLYLLGISCPVQRWTIPSSQIYDLHEGNVANWEETNVDSDQRNVDNEWITRFDIVWDRIRPTRLSLILNDEYQVPEHMLDNYLDVLGGSQTQAPTHLSIKFRQHAWEWNEEDEKEDLVVSTSIYLPVRCTHTTESAGDS